MLKKAVAKEPDQRYNSAHTLTRALEDVTLRVEGAEDLTPYPGLAAFTEDDAEYFFGREAEVEPLWREARAAAPARRSSARRARARPRSSGPGLSRDAPTGWAIMRCTPGQRPVLALGAGAGAETGR